MPSKTSLTEPQTQAVDRLYETDATILVAPTGEGKTIICLSAIKDLLISGVLSRVVIACPPKVVPVWGREAAKWSHTEGLEIVELVGDPDQRVNLMTGADGIVIDELSKAAGKQTAGLRTKSRGGCFTWRVGLTATPVSQDFQKLYGLCRIIDGGAVLGKNKDKFLRQYFIPDYFGHNWELREGADAEIMFQVAPLVHLIEDKKADKLPPLNKATRWFLMGEPTREAYDQMRATMEVGDIDAANAAVQSGKLRQLASGFLYDDKGAAHVFDTHRVETAVEWLVDLGDRPGIIFYEYVAQAEMFMDLLGSGVQHQYAPCHTPLEFMSSDHGLLIAQINSLSHGVEGLQYLCHDVLFLHPFWSRDAQEQAIGRVWRTGQTEPVTVTTLMCTDSLDEVVAARVAGREEWMELFEKHINNLKK